MSVIPPNQVTTQDLIDWWDAAHALASLKLREMLLRKKIFKGFFPTPMEGGKNKHTLPDGYILAGDHNINRKIDEPVLLAMWDDFIQKGINPNELIRRKPELNTTAYRQLTEEQRNFFDQALIISDGSPELEIKPPAKPKGKAGQKAVPTAQS